MTTRLPFYGPWQPATKGPLYCPQCKIDLMSNPSANCYLVNVDLGNVMELRGDCDCGARSIWTYYTDTNTAELRMWNVANAVSVTFNFRW